VRAPGGDRNADPDRAVVHLHDSRPAAAGGDTAHEPRPDPRWGGRAHLAGLIARFRERTRELPWTLIASPTAIQSLIVGGNEETLALAGALWRRGIWVPAIRPPTVPRGTARLRVSLTAAHTVADVDALTDALVEIARSA
jgi:selenocysteine lyase/cysteine desulfurase